MTKILTLCGSARSDSINKKTVLCVSDALNSIGADVTVISLNDYAMPIYDGDEEASNGLPDAARQLKACLKEHDGFLIGCPEYNGFMTPLLINAISWATRSEDANLDTSSFMGKPVLVTSSSPGPGGGTRAAVHLKTLLSGIGCIISPANFMVAGGFSAFDESGKLLDEGTQNRAQKIAGQFNDFVSRLT